MKTTEQLIKDITEYVNTYGDKSKEFNTKMECQHRTLQQCFTGLCLKWIEHVASDEYHTDARNEASKEMAKKLLELFAEYQKKCGFTGQVMLRPSSYLPMI